MSHHNSRLCQCQAPLKQEEIQADATVSDGDEFPTSWQIPAAELMPIGAQLGAHLGSPMADAYSEAFRLLS